MGEKISDLNHREAISKLEDMLGKALEVASFFNNHNGGWRVTELLNDEKIKEFLKEAK